MAIGAFHSDAFDVQAFSEDAFLFDEAGVVVPDVVGQSQASGTAELEAEGFVVAVTTAYSSVVPAGDIISQAPTAGTEVASGSTVTITVSLGDAPDDDGYYEAWAGRRKREQTSKRPEARVEQSAVDEERALMILWGLMQ